MADISAASSMNQFILKRFYILLFISAVLFLGGNDLLHLTDPDEVFYSLSAREMAERNEWLTPYIFGHPQFEKPILTYDLIRIAFDAFGQTPFAARFFPAVFGCFGVLAVYALGLAGFSNERRSFLAALILCTSAFYMSMAKTVFTDMIFSVFMLYALLSFYLSYINSAYRIWGLLAFFVFTGLAVLTKGPLGLVIPLVVVILFLLYKRDFSFLKNKWFVVGLVVSLFVSVPWYWYQIIHQGDIFIKEFFTNVHWRRFIEAEHLANDSWYFYPVTMFAGFFPWTFFLGAAFIDMFRRLKVGVKPFDYFLLSWILVVFIVFQAAHSKLTSYILPMFPALALLTAGYIEDRLESNNHRVIKVLSYVLMGGLLLLAAAVILAYDAYKAYVPSIVPAFWLSAVLIAIVGLAVTFVLKDKIRHALYLLAFCLAPVFITAFMIRGDIEPHVSMYESSLYVPSAQMQKTTILTSKAFARGVAYHTHQEVAVINMNGKNYFSPHPIPIITSEEALEIFLSAQQETYAIVRRAHYEDITKHVSDKFNVHLLKRAGSSYILRIEPLKQT